MGKDLVSAGIQLGIGQPNSLATGDLAMAIGIADVRIEGRPLSTLQLSQQQVKGYLFWPFYVVLDYPQRKFV